MWNKSSLKRLVKGKMSEYKFIVVSNRQPYIHVLRKGKVECLRGAGGVITALDPVMQACNGSWVAFASGEADKKMSDKFGRLKVPPEKPSYTLRRIWLKKEEVDGHYYGYSNSALWPLCHMAFQRPIFRKEDFEYYKKVNKIFAEVVLDEIGDGKAFVFIQDYHLALLAGYLKEKAGNRVVIAHFWHIPWPGFETFRICPQSTEILRGMLSSDLLGFHIRYHCDNFLDCVDRLIECKIDREKFSISALNHETLIRPYPISVDFDGINKVSSSDGLKKLMQDFRQEYGLSDVKILLGVDRIDYTKGILERLYALDRLLEKRPELKKKVVFIQMGEISRIHIPLYKELNDRLNAAVEEINWKHSVDNWKPVVFVRKHLSFNEVLAFYRLADVCLISSLHDGMNLVAKEFVASRPKGDAMLVLSKFTGASRELEEAVLVNPYDREEFSEGIFEALSMGKKEKAARMQKMRLTVAHNNIYRWAGKIISELLKFEFEE